MSSDNLTHEHSAMQAVAIPYTDAWLKANPGIFAEVARQLSRKKRVSRQFVRMVFRGTRRSVRVERALRRLRAPGFERSLRSAA